MKHTFVVIGSNSFSGAHFVKHLLKQNHNVIGMSRSNELDPVFLPYKNLNSQLQSSFQFHAADLNKDIERMMTIIRESRADYVVNFAAQSMVAESWANPDHWFATNVLANVKLHEELRKIADLKRYVHVSTPEVYGNCTGNINEDARFNPSTPYAASRAAADLSLMTYYKYYNFPVCFTRAANVYGPSQQLYRIIPKTILCILKGKKLPLHGGGSSVRSFIHIDDVADATLKVCEIGTSGNAYHLSTKEQVSIADLVRKICSRLNIDFEKAVEIVGERAGKDAAYLLDSSRALNELAWSPKISLDQGLDETIAWVRSNYEKLKDLPDYYIHKP